MTGAVDSGLLDVSALLGGARPGAGRIAVDGASLDLRGPAWRTSSTPASPSSRRTAPARASRWR